jgi:hypothetical protein
VNVHQQVRFGLAEISMSVSGLTGDMDRIAPECNSPSQFQCIVLQGAGRIISASLENPRPKLPLV